MSIVLILATLWSLGLLVVYLTLPRRDLSALAAKRWAPWFVVAVALLARILPNLFLPVGAGYDIGSYDIVGDLVLERADVYASPLAVKRYPYLPLQMYWSAFAKWLAQISGAPFLQIVRLLPIAGDVGLAWVLLKGIQKLTGSRRAGLLGGLLYACNPVSVLVSAYHGQFDSVPALFVLLAWYVWLSGKTSHRRLLGSAFWMGGAILIKSWPVLLLPVMLFQVKGWRKRLLYLATAGAVSIGAILFYLVAFSGDLALLISRALGYNHGIGIWGYTYLIRMVSVWRPPLYRVFGWFVANGRYVTLAALAAAFLIRARREPAHQGFLTVLVTFFACTHAFSIQYLVWIVPFALLSRQHKWLARYTLGTLAYSILAYMTLILDMRITKLLPWPQADIYLIIPAGLPAWLVTVGWAWERLTAKRDLAGESAG